MGERDESTTPRTRSMHRVVEACVDVEGELSFQLMRLEQHVAPRTEEEAQYFADLKAGYETARRYIRILRRYQEGRLARKMGDVVQAEPEEDSFVIDAAGKASAYFGED